MELYNVDMPVLATASSLVGISSIYKPANVETQAQQPQQPQQLQKPQIAQVPQSLLTQLNPER
jgi:hypothetical protein